MTSKKAKFALVTEKHFWEVGYGANMRIQSLIAFLNKRTHLSIYILDTLDKVSIRSFSEHYPGAVLRYLAEGSGLTRTNCHAVLERWLKKGRFDKVIIEHLWNHHIADIVPPTSEIILDTHDIISLQIESFTKYGRVHPLKLTIDQEFEIYNKFDKVMFIQRVEYEEGCRRLGDQRCLLCQHHVAVQPRLPVNEGRKIVGFLSSPWQPNIDGLIWFSENVVPLVQSVGAEFHVYGTICGVDEISERCPNVKFKGSIDNLEQFYGAVDVVVNPALYGSGLKIKSVEALAFGLPLVTSSIGAQGLEQGVGVVYRSADTAHEFSQVIESVLGSGALRNQMSHAAQEFISNNFTADECFGVLLT